MKDLINSNQNLILEKSINEVLEDFLLFYNSIQTKKRYKIVLSEFLDFLKIKQLEDLNKYHISDIYTSFELYKDSKSKHDKDNHNKILNPSTLNNIAYIIRAFFKYLIDYYNYPKNPLSHYKPLKTKEHSITHSLDRSELLDIIRQSKKEYLDSLYKTKNIKKHLTKSRNFLIFALLSLSLRREEICNIKWDDLKEDKFLLIGQKWGTSKYIPIPSWLIDYFLKFKEEKFINGYQSSYMFTAFLNWFWDNLNTPIYATYIMKITQKMCERLHINKKITPHSFRKTFIEIALDKNENYNNIMNATGHKTTQMVRYYDYRDKVKNNAINSFEDLFY